MTTRISGQNNTKNHSTSSHSPRRNKDRKKDREREKDRERDRDRGKDRDKDNHQNRKIPHQTSNYEDFDYSPINNNPIHNTYYNVDYNERNIDRNIDRSAAKQSKGFILNKPFGHWPFHSDKDINNYFGNKTEPKYYLGKRLINYKIWLLKALFCRNSNIGYPLFSHL